jgi:hypothetical protein
MTDFACFNQISDTLHPIPTSFTEMLTNLASTFFKVQVPKISVKLAKSVISVLFARFFHGYWYSHKLGFTVLQWKVFKISILRKSLLLLGTFHQGRVKPNLWAFQWTKKKLSVERRKSERKVSNSVLFTLLFLGHYRNAHKFRIFTEERCSPTFGHFIDQEKVERIYRIWHFSLRFSALYTQLCSQFTEIPTNLVKSI